MATIDQIREFHHAHRDATEQLSHLRAAVKEADRFPEKTECDIAIAILGGEKFEMPIPLETAIICFQDRIRELEYRLADMDSTMSCILINREGGTTHTG